MWVIISCVMLGACPIERLSNVVLDGKGITGVQDVEGLVLLCRSVKELHLPCNKITHSRDVSSVCPGGGTC